MTRFGDDILRLLEVVGLLAPCGYGFIFSFVCVLFSILRRIVVNYFLNYRYFSPLKLINCKRLKQVILSKPYHAKDVVKRPPVSAHLRSPLLTASSERPRVRYKAAHYSLRFTGASSNPYFSLLTEHLSHFTNRSASFLYHQQPMLGRKARYTVVSNHGRSFNTEA